LENKHALDALVITPRVCGICGHAHLMATVRALEDAYKNAGYEIKLSKKAGIIREFTLVMEMIQNHFKWIYLTIIPELAKLKKSDQNQTPLKGAFAANIASKAIATFAGQWPHSSYMLPGGVSNDPTNIDILKAQSYVDELIGFFEKESLGISLDKFLSFESCKDFGDLKSDISDLEASLLDVDMHKKGFAFDRFLIIGEHTFTKASKLKQTRAYNVDSKYVSTTPSYSPKQKSYAKNALYKDNYYETGPLARLMALNNSIVKNMHRRFKDSAYSRVMARVFELAYLLKHAQKVLKEIDISEVSYSRPVDISEISASGVGVVEAPRGPLLHRVSIENGVIKSYEIITPTQFNIGSNTPSNPTPVQKAMTGLTQEEALFVFRTFDVCSVCTTH
jgi:Ni,Fe-hydrogenase I large subunit